MSANGSGDEQSEDGELRQSPTETKPKQPIVAEVNISDDEDVDNIDALDIKPPQARAIQSSKSKRRDGHDSRSHHKRPDRHRDDRHSHRDKHHREKSLRPSSGKDRAREHYEREKERYYRDQLYAEGHGSYKDRREDRHGGDARAKYEEKKMKEARYEKHRRDRYEEEKRDRADKALQDLRDRLLSKRTRGSEDDSAHRQDKGAEGGGGQRSRKHRDAGDNIDSALQGEAGMYVKDIINITSGDERRYRKEDKGESLTEEERAQQELRREKLLEAEREMSRLKEQSRMERERRHLERASKRRQEEEQHELEAYKKRIRMAEEAPIVTLSDDNSAEEEVEEGEAPIEYEPRRVDEDEEEEEDHKSIRSDDSRRSSRSSSVSHGGRSSSKSRGSSSRSLEGSDRSKTASPASDGEPEMEDPKETLEKERNPTKPKIDEGLPPYYPAISGCRSVEEFQCLNRIEEGTYGVVYRARDKRTEEIVALKRLKMEKEKEGFPITSLREINTLLKGQHPNIVTVREIVVGSNMDKIFIVMDYVEHDLKSLMETMRHKKQTFMPGEIKCLLRQLLLAVAHLHDNWILHRDLKTSNLLLSHKGILKVGDFGLAREYGSPLKPYTPIVVTLWYRAPELLLCAKEYSTKIDMWSVGCIFAELLLMNAVFPGKSEVDQLNRIFKDLGTPTEKVWTGFNELPAVRKMKFAEYPVGNLRQKFNTLSEIGLGLLLKFLTYDPVKRVSAEEALQHTYFNEPPLPIDPAMFPTWPAKSEVGQKRALAASPKPPSGGGEYKKLGGDVDDNGYGFRIGMGIDNRRGGPGFSLKF